MLGQKDRQEHEMKHRVLSLIEREEGLAALGPNQPFHVLTNHTEGFAGELQPSPPPSVATATASRPDPHDVLHSKHHDGHDFLRSRESQNRAIYSNTVHHKAGEKHHEFVPVNHIYM